MDMQDIINEIETKEKVREINMKNKQLREYNNNMTELMNKVYMKA